MSIVAALRCPPMCARKCLHIIQFNRIIINKKKKTQLKRECCKFFVKHRHNVLQSSKKDYYMEHSIQIDEIIDSVCYTAPDNERHDTY